MKASVPTIPTVSRVSGETIIELVYDAGARTTALAISRDGTCSIEPSVEIDGERLVPYAPTNNLIHHGCVMLPSGPVNHGNKETLLKDIEAYLDRYVDLSPLFRRLAAHYVLLSWVFDAFNELPYLRFQGDYGSGKTRALIAVGSIAYKAFFASGASTVSPIFHTLDSFGGTLILDEADLRFSGKTADLVKILNNGTVKGLPVLRTLQNRNKEFEPAAFTVFGPKIVAMRGAFRDEALESRFLTERMGLRPLRPDIPIQLPDGLKTDALALRNRLLHFRMTNLATLKKCPEALIADIDPRLNQMAAPLLSLIDDEALRADIEALLKARQAEFSVARAQSIERRTLDAVGQVFEDVDRTAISLRDLAAEVNASGDGLEEPVTPRQVGQVLRTRSIALKKSNGIVFVPRASIAR